MNQLSYRHEQKDLFFVKSEEENANIRNLETLNRTSIQIHSLNVKSFHILMVANTLNVILCNSNLSMKPS